jgi:hypothetical protein
MGSSKCSKVITVHEKLESTAKTGIKKEAASDTSFSPSQTMIAMAMM